MINFQNQNNGEIMPRFFINPRKNYHEELHNIFSIRSRYLSPGKQTIANKIKKYGDYKIGWDGYDGVPATNRTIEDAITFLQKIPEFCALPYSGLAGDGEVDLFGKKERYLLI